jgi:integrase/recombinase XerD
MKKNNEDIEAFKIWLKEKGYKSNTIENNYLPILRRYFTFLEKENLSIETVSYTDALKLLKEYREKEKTPAYINSQLRLLRKYYSYKKQTESIHHNPFLNLQVRGEKKRLPHDILSKSYIENIYESYPENTEVRKRNKVMIGLVVFQGLRQEEFEDLEPHEVDLRKATLYIKGHGKVKGRTVQLQSRQIILFEEYLKEVRPEILKQRKDNNYRLFITEGHYATIKQIVRELTMQIRKRHSLFKNFTHIRTSLIVHWLKEKPIREVQHLAGHSNIASTEIYKQANMEDLKQELDRFHPLR